MTSIFTKRTVKLFLFGTLSTSVPSAYSQNTKNILPENELKKKETPSNTIPPQIEDKNLKRAKKAFEEKDYDKAIKLYRVVIRNNRKNYDAWTLLGAAYFHTGIPKRALRYLKLAENRTTLGSFNYFYQGLSLDALEERSKARLSYKRAVVFQDSYGARALYELGVTDYNDKSYKNAAHWLNTYVQKFPNGKYRSTAIKLLNSIQQGIHIEGVEGVQKPSMEKAMYKYNSLSLHNSPHYWFAQLGIIVEEKTLKYPAEGGKGIEEKVDQKQGLLSSAGIGIGPYKQGRTSISAGYTYNQIWYTNGQRVEEYLEDFTDFAYQPYRLDLLERTHEFYSDLRVELPLNLYAGLFSKIAFSRIGSSFYAGPQAESFTPKVQKISDTTLNIPWIGIAWSKDARSLAYMYFRKEINEETPEFSNKSYSFESSDSSPLSFGITHAHSFPKYRLNLNAELFQYSFVANDYWLDYTRQGLIGSVEHEFLKGFYIQLLGGYYKDSYPESIFKSRGCKTGAVTGTDEIGTATVAAPPAECFRDDSGYILKIQAYWYYTTFHRILGEFSFSQNTNPELQEFDSQTKTFRIVATMAFPGVRKVSRQVERFSDNAFTKQPE